MIIHNYLPMRHFNKYWWETCPLTHWPAVFFPTIQVMNYILTIREHVPASDDTKGGILVSNIDASRFGSVARLVSAPSKESILSMSLEHDSATAHLVNVLASWINIFCWQAMWEKWAPILMLFFNVFTAGLWTIRAIPVRASWWSDRR